MTRGRDVGEGTLGEKGHQEGFEFGLKGDRTSAECV